MAKKFIRRTGRYKRKSKGLKKVFRRAARNYKRRIFKRRELVNAETKYMYGGSNIFALTNAASTNDVTTEFHDVVFAGIPSEGAGYDDRVGLKYRSLSSTYTFTWCNPINKSTDFLSGKIGRAHV